MSIRRLNIAALERIIEGKVKEDATCVVKFYSNGCHLCHALQEYYANIAEEDQYSDLHFFDFNVDDHPHIEKRLKFDGVPTISVIRTRKGPGKSTVRIMPEPDNPNQKTWYKVKDIKNFIEREK